MTAVPLVAPARRERSKTFRRFTANKLGVFGLIGYAIFLHPVACVDTHDRHGADQVPGVKTVKDVLQTEFIDVLPVVQQ